MKKILIILFICTVSVRLPAMDREAALSMIESGDNDNAIGAAGEFSRYQILPATWDNWVKRYGFVGSKKNSPTDCYTLMWLTQSMRSIQFANSHHGRWPTDAEWYLLWSCPNRVDHPSKFKAEVAQRFANLCKVP